MSSAAGLSAWTGRDDGDDPRVERWHQRVREVALASLAADSLQGAIVFIGYPTDAGVRANSGRPGAAAGPKALRRAMGGLPAHGEWALRDAGDADVSGVSVAIAQERLAEATRRVCAAGGKPIILGGGHDCAFGAWRGAFDSLGDRSNRGLISINIDAHLDNRPLDGASPHSGTSYTQMQQYCERAGVPFLALAVGIQRMSNTALLFERAAQAGIAIATRDGVANGNCESVLRATLEGESPIHLTLDLDALAVSAAPGVSAPNGVGLSAADVVRILDALPWNRVIAVDVAECAPGLDADDRTARTAAALIFEVVERWVRA